MRKLEQIWFRYFSEATLDSQEDGWVRYTVAFTLFMIAMAGVACDMLGYHTPAKVLFLIFSIALSLFGALWITVFFYHNWRIRHESNT